MSTRTSMSSKTLSTILLISLVGLSGCDQIKSQFDDWFGDPTPEKISADMQKSVSGGKVDDAIAVGEKFVSKYADPDNKIRQELVQLYLSKGDTNGAMRHMQAMVSSGVISSSSSVSITTTTPAAQNKSNSKTQSNSETVISVDGASVRTGPGGTEVRAGDAVVRTPK